MSQEGLDQLAERWKSDPEFRAALRRDPEGTVVRAGIELDEAELAVVRDTDWSKSDDELQTRMAPVEGISGPPA